MIDFLGNIFNIILNEAEKNNNFNNAKNCIILSQTFYYDNKGEKYYVLENIRNHRWLSSPDYWIKTIDLMLEPEFNKLIERYPEITKEDIINNTEKITNSFKKKIGDIIYSQILPFVNNMKEFGITLVKIVEIAEDIMLKYDFLSEEEKNSVFSLISDNQEEVNKLREIYAKKAQINKKNKNEINNNITQLKPQDDDKNDQNIKNKKAEEIHINKSKEGFKNSNNNKKEDNKNNNEENKEKNNDIKKKKNNENEKKLNTNIVKNNDNIILSKSIKKEIEEQELSNSMRSISINIINSRKKEKIDKSQKENNDWGIFKGLKSKFINKDKTTKENEDKIKDAKDDKRGINIEQQNQIKKDLGNKMVKTNFEQNKLPLKPIPKNDNSKINKDENKIKQENSVANAFGVVLKKIDKGKKGK